MKANKHWVARLGVGIVAVGLVEGVLSPSARAQVAVSASLQINSPTDFYNPLTPYGTWINVGPYGRCWRPANLPPDWRPYEIGHWEWTDCGWYWASDEPWAWACYHYGGWELAPNYGWVWVPGTEWAPAWVVWREAPDYIGWAPCGPGGVALAGSNFMFVDVHHFHDRIEPRSLVFNDPRIFRRSHAVGGFRRENRDFDGFHRQVAINQGPGIAPIQRATGAKFTARPVRELIRQNPVPETARQRLNQTEKERHETVTRDQSRQPNQQEQKRLYREAPSTQPAPTGRQEPRIYREAPNSRSTAQPSPAPGQVPRHQPSAESATPPSVPRTVPETPRAVPQTPRATPQTPRAAPETPRQVPRRQPLPEPTPQVPHQTQPLPPTGAEHGRREQPAPRREEATPRAVPAPAPNSHPAAPPQPSGRDKDKDRSS